jgi:hypothetical protein
MLVVVKLSAVVSAVDADPAASKSEDALVAAVPNPRLSLEDAALLTSLRLLAGFNGVKPREPAAVGTFADTLPPEDWNVTLTWPLGAAGVEPLKLIVVDIRACSH